MEKIAWRTAGLGAILLIASSYIIYTYKFTASEASGLYGQCLVIVGAVLVFYQMKINLNYNKRKATSDFMFGPVQVTLLPLEIKLKELLSKEFLVFDPQENLSKKLKSNDLNDAQKKELKETVINILNFYERMSISILSESFDEVMCYDDKGLLLIEFHKWTLPYIRELESEVEERAYANSALIVESWQVRYNKQRQNIKNTQQKNKRIRAIQNTPIS